jgi:hypothetical protein
VRTKDSDGKWVRSGDAIRFSYGIPPAIVKASVVERDGKLIALTPGHNPAECELRKLKEYVGAFYREQPQHLSDS